MYTATSEFTAPIHARLSAVLISSDGVETRTHSSFPFNLLEMKWSKTTNQIAQINHFSSLLVFCSQISAKISLQTQSYTDFEPFTIKQLIRPCSKQLLCLNKKEIENWCCIFEPIDLKHIQSCIKTLINYFLGKVSFKRKVFEISHSFSLCGGYSPTWKSIFSHKSNSTITNVRLSVCHSTKALNNLKLSSFIIHPSFILRLLSFSACLDYWNVVLFNS